MTKIFAGLTLEEIAKTHKDNELVKALVTEIVRLRAFENECKLYDDAARGMMDHEDAEILKMLMEKYECQKENQNQSSPK